MKKIGITGGVGAGKSAVLDYLSSRYGAYICKADDLARTLEEPGHDCYNRLVEEFGNDILKDDGYIDNAKFAEKIFSDSANLGKVNGIVHPAVRQQILNDINELSNKGTDVYILEAALLIECGYQDILDEIWYIYVSEENRRCRLKESRGYSDEKIDGIFSSQMTEDEFKKGCKRIIDNNGSLDETKKDIDKHMQSIGVC